MFGKKKDKDEKDEKKDDDKKDEDDKDKKDEENEDEEEEEEVEEHVTNENDYRTFPPEAQEWAERVLGNVRYAKYYQFAQGRTDSDCREMLRTRSWSVQIQNIKFTNLGNKPYDFFLNFGFGWDFRVSRQLIKIKGTAPPPPPQAKGPNGKPGAAKEKRWEWVESGSFGLVNLTKVCQNVEKGNSAVYDDAFAFTWRGSYFDLYRKSLHVEVWDWNRWTPNTYLAQYEKKLRELASGTIDQEWAIYTQVRKRGKVESVNVGSLRFQLIFQERLKYTVNLSNWSATVDPSKFLDDLEPNGKPVEIAPYAVFNLHRPMNTPYSSWRVQSRAVQVFIKYGEPHKKIEFGELSTMTFYGTRSELEAGTLYIDVYDQGVNSPIIGSAAIALKSVIETGSLSSPLTRVKRSYGDLVTKACCFPSVRGAGVILRDNVHDLGAASQRTFTYYTGISIVSNKQAADDEDEDVVQGPELSGHVSGSFGVDVLSQQSSLARALKFHKDPKRMWREFAQTGEPNPPDLRDHPPYNSAYLCVRIVQGKNLVAADPSGTSDPYVTVQWGEQRVRTSIVFEDLNPIFDEDLVFLVRCFDPQRIRLDELAKVPVIHFQVWDYDPAGSSDALGHAKVYLHQITGCGLAPPNANSAAASTSGKGAASALKPSSIRVERTPEEQAMEWIPTLATRKVTVRRRHHPNGVWRMENIDVRIFRAELPLQGLSPGERSTLTVECYFRTNEGDIYERSPRRRALTGTDLIVLPPLVTLEKELNTSCLCQPFQRLARPALGGGSTPANFLKRDMCEGSRAYARGQLVAKCALLASFKSALKRVENPHAEDLRAFLRHADIDAADFMARDQMGNRHWLPTYCHPISPPRPMMDSREISSMHRPNSLFIAAQLVRAIDFDLMTDSILSTLEARTWVSPDYLLTMRKGDVKSHVLLLCNLFLGLRADAYVVLGYARGPVSAEAVMRVREEARKSKWTSAKRAQELGKLKGKPVPYVWLMTRETSSNSVKLPPGSQPGKRLGGAVKFWDVTRGAYYTPLPNRWEGMDDRALLQQQQKRKRELVVGTTNQLKSDQEAAAERARREQQQQRSAAAASKRGRSPFAPEHLMTEKDLLEQDEEEEDVGLPGEFNYNSAKVASTGGNRKGTGADVGIDVDQVFALGDGFIGDHWGTTLDPYGGGLDTDEEAENAGDPDRSREEEEENGGEAHNTPPPAPVVTLNSEHVALIKDKLETRRRFIFGKRQRKRETMLRARMPFTKILAVFNDKNLFLNTQANAEPWNMHFDLEYGALGGWIPTLTEEQGVFVQPWYPPRNLGPKLTEDKVAQFTRQIEDEVEAGLENLRGSHNVRTRFAGSEMSKLLGLFVTEKHNLDMLDRIESNGWSVTANQGKGGWVHPDSKGFIQDQLVEALSRALLHTVPRNFSYRIGFARFNSTSALDIRKMVLEHPWRAASEAEANADESTMPNQPWVESTLEGKDPLVSHVSIHEESHDGAETFCVAARIFPFYNHVAVCKLAIIVVFPTPNTGKLPSKGKGRARKGNDDNQIVSPAHEETVNEDDEAPLTGPNNEDDQGDVVVPKSILNARNQPPSPELDFEMEHAFVQNEHDGEEKMPAPA